MFSERHFLCLWHRKLSFWQVPVRAVMKISSEWQHFPFQSIIMAVALRCATNDVSLPMFRRGNRLQLHRRRLNMRCGDKMGATSQTSCQIHIAVWKLLYFYSNPNGPINNKPTLVQMIVWRQATSHYLNQWWLSLLHIDGLVQERLNSIANALELRLSCTNPLICASPGVDELITVKNSHYIWSMFGLCCVLLLFAANRIQPFSFRLHHWHWDNLTNEGLSQLRRSNPKKYW